LKSVLSPDTDEVFGTMLVGLVMELVALLAEALIVVTVPVELMPGIPELSMPLVLALPVVLMTVR
jgi:energy-coupling factor transporter transmembrane protein EcfT